MNMLLPIILSVITWLSQRSQEPSTHAGIALGAQFIQSFIPDSWTWLPGVLDFITAASTALAIALREKAVPKS